MVTVCLTCTANSVVSREREESSPSSLYTRSCFPYCSLIAINIITHSNGHIIRFPKCQFSVSIFFCRREFGTVSCRFLNKSLPLCVEIEEDILSCEFVVTCTKTCPKGPTHWLCASV